MAQLADEVKRLTKSSIAEALVNPPSFADQAVEAKQSSVELQARGKAQGTPGMWDIISPQ